MTSLPRLTPPLFSPAVRRWLPLIVGLAVGLRVALGWMHPIEQPDSADYEKLAAAIVGHQPYALLDARTGDTLVASRMPGYPLLLAGIYFCGGGVKTLMVLQALMGGATVCFTYLIARRINPAIALPAATLIALDPLSIGFGAAVLSETPFTLCLMAALWLCLRIGETPGRALGRWVVLGVLWGVAVYLRAEALWVIVPLALLAAWPGWRAGARWRLAAAAIPILLTFAMLLPWWIRNDRHFHTGFFRMTTLEGISLYEAVYPEADGGPRQDKITLPPEMKPLDEAQRSDEWSRRAWAYIKEDPLRIAGLAVVKVGRTWSPWFNATEWRGGPVQIAMTLWNVPLLALGLLGMVRTRGRVALLLLTPVAYLTALHALFLGSVRYRVALLPIVCILAGQGIISLWNWMAGAKRSPS